MSNTTKLSDLTLRINNIEFHSRFILIYSTPLHAKKKQAFNKPAKIDRALNEKLVSQLVIGNEYRIKQEQVFKEDVKFEFNWTQATNLSTKKAHLNNLDELFE